MLIAMKKIEWMRLAGLLGILVLAAVLRSHLTSSGLPGVVLPRHDEAHYVPTVVQFLQGQWEIGYFVNPTLYMYLLYAVTALTGLFLVVVGRYPSWDGFVTDVTLDTGLVTMVGRSLTLTAGLASVVLVYCIGRRMFSPRVGLIAALALALDRTHVERSTLAGNEVVLVLLLLIFFLVLLRYVERPSVRLHVSCGILLGLAMSTKYSGAIHLPTLAAGSLCAAIAVRPGRSLIRQLIRPRYWVGFPCALLAFVLASPWVLLAHDKFLKDFARQAAFLHEGFSFADKQANEYGWITYIREFPFGNLGLFFAVLCALGIGAAIWRTIRQRNSNCALLLAACLPAYLYLGSGIFADMRFLLVAIPFVLILGAWALDGIAAISIRGYDRIRKRTGGEWRDAVLVTSLLLLLVPHARGLDRDLNRRFKRDIRAELLVWMREALNPEDIYLDLYLGEQRFFAIEPMAAWLRVEKVGSAVVQREFVELRERYLTSQDIVALLRHSDGFEEFCAALEQHAAKRLIVISPLPSGSRGTHRQLLRQALNKVPRYGRYRSRSRSKDCWKEMIEFLAGLEIEAVKGARDRRTWVWILKLP